MTYEWPDLGTVYLNGGAAVVGAGVEFADVGGFGLGISPSVDVSDSGFVITYPVGWVFAPPPKTFDGWVVADIFGTLPGFAGVSLSTNIVGFDASQVSFDENHVYVNQLGFGGFGAGAFIAVDVRFVPEPASLALLGLGLLGFGLVRRKHN